MAKRSKTESAKSKVESAVALGDLGASLGGPVGGAVGALTGLIIGDARYVFPVDMVAIPAYQAYLMREAPIFQVYIRAGESLVPTGGNVEDVQEVVETEPVSVAQKPKKKKTAYQRRYSKAFEQVKNKHKLRSGKWKKDGFKKAVREAHKIAGGK